MSNVDSSFKVVVLQNPQILLDAISERINALAAINQNYPRYMGTLYSASKEVEDDIGKLLDELDEGIDMLQDPDEWIKVTKVGLQANRTEVNKARAFLAQYGQ